MTTAYGVTMGSCIATLLIVTAKGVFKRVLPAEEYAEIRWDQLEAGDVNFIKDFYYRLAHRVGELSHPG